jgi:hypothetical protein
MMLIIRESCCTVYVATVQTLQGVPRGAVQLVAVACMLLASKQDEVG